MQWSHRVAPNTLIAVGLGILTGGFAAWAYYDQLLRPLAHMFGLWITAVTLVSYGRSAWRALLASCVCLGLAVVTFYVGLKVIYDNKYPGGGYFVNTDRLGLWLILAAIVGSGLGLIFRWAGQPGSRGAIGTAASVGLLAADGYRRWGHSPSDAHVILPFVMLAVLVVLIATVRSKRRLVEVAVWTVPSVVIGIVLVSAPDMLEQWLITVG